MHKIDLEKYNTRTDMITDFIEKNENNIISKTYKNDNVNITYVKLEDNNPFNKKKGDYITLEFDDVTDDDSKKEVEKVFKETLKEFLIDNGFNKNTKTLVVGLGNQKSTPDSLGSIVCDKTIVTKHLFDMNVDVEDKFSNVSVFKPGVVGTTGIETSDLIKAVASKTKPDLLIVVDSLSSSSIDRVNKSIQISNTGICPGSGIDNNRKEVSFDTINVPVIVIGVPTVTKASTIVFDTINYMIKNYVFNKEFSKKKASKFVHKSINYLKEDVQIDANERKNLLGLVGSLNDEELMNLIYEVLTPIGYNLVVTPKEIDFVMEKLSDIVSYGINGSLHDI